MTVRLVDLNMQNTPLIIAETARFANVQLEQLQGEIYGLCKDQHGCRYLQKKLEERNPEHIQIIFLETNQHVVELMTGTRHIRLRTMRTANLDRSLWQLPLSKAARILQ